MTATLLENFAVALTGLSVFIYVNDDSIVFDNINGVEPLKDCSNPLSSNYFRLALIFGSIDVIFSSLLSMIISKEWVAYLFYSDFESSKKSKQSDLASANALLSQIDLVVGASCPLIISKLIPFYGYNLVLAMVIIQHLIGAGTIILCIRQAISLQPNLLHAGILKEKDSDKVNDKTEPPLDSFTSIFKSLPIRTRLISTAYIFLYFTILSPGAMLNSWLNSLNDGGSLMTEQTIAYFGSASQLCGALATIITPILIQRTKSLYKAAEISQWFQMGCVVFASISFYRLQQIKSGQQFGATVSELNVEVLRFLVSIGLSRIGLWSFDLVERQILQESVPRLHQTLFFNGEKSATQLFTLVMMALCYIFPNPRSFSILVAWSLSAVCCSSFLILLQSYL